MTTPSSDDPTNRDAEPAQLKKKLARQAEELDRLLGNELTGPDHVQAPDSSGAKAGPLRKGWSVARRVLLSGLALIGVGKKGLQVERESPVLPPVAGEVQAAQPVEGTALVEALGEVLEEYVEKEAEDAAKEKTLEEHRRLEAAYRSVLAWVRRGRPGTRSRRICFRAQVPRDNLDGLQAVRLEFRLNAAISFVDYSLRVWRNQAPLIVSNTPLADGIDLPDLAAGDRLVASIEVVERWRIRGSAPNGPIMRVHYCDLTWGQLDAYYYNDFPARACSGPAPSRSKGKLRRTVG